MGVLMRTLADPARRPLVIADASAVIDSEVASKSGLRGMGLKAGYKAFKAIRPGIVPLALERLLPHFAPSIDPLWEEAVASGNPKKWFADHDAQVADALLAVTDGMAKRAQNAVMIRIYNGLRGQARDHVLAGVPRIPELIARHVG